MTVAAGPGRRDPEPRAASGGDPRRGRRLVAEVVEVLTNGLYALEPVGTAAAPCRRCVGHLSGAMRVQAVRLCPGERVDIELSPLDPAKARILGRAGSGRQDMTADDESGEGKPS